ncbi:hypothetical protein I7I50_06044 [Histoplasma capsulatum G186AR]|uniref:Uncharacterized protein n=1 Tax=Ajellomyces capsulatus TaxID=5037 RepID=A0A8H7Z001_AJECA|nr:hypothetical protein I7I52_08782 [Histoplasma capsulatum]QSS67068.1 hypothetical protein I7I50_06044 [Histoplasma capsulatum G186AR]
MNFELAEPLCHVDMLMKTSPRGSRGIEEARSGQHSSANQQPRFRALSGGANANEPILGFDSVMLPIGVNHCIHNNTFSAGI